MTGTKHAGVILQNRDRRLLAEIAKMRLIDREIAMVVGPYHSVNRANMRLLQLTRAGLLNRFFVGTIGSGRKAIYTLAQKARVELGATQDFIHRPNNRTVVGDQFVGHQMAVNQLYLHLTHRPAPASVQSVRWRTFSQSLTRNSRLKPDGYVEITAHDGIRSMFIEADLGTEALRRWTEKVRTYLSFATSGEFTRVFSRPQFRVLVIVNSARRLNNLRKTVAQQTDKVFWFATFEDINRSGIWSAVWLRPTGDQRVSLL